MPDFYENEIKPDEPLVNQELTSPALGSSSSKVLSPDIVGSNIVVQPNGDIKIGDYDGGQGVLWDQSAGTFSIKGGLLASSLDIPDAITANSFHVDTNGNAWWGATTLAGAIAKIVNTGVATFTNIVVTGGSVATATLNGIIALANLNIANRGWSQTCIFSVTDADTVAWAAGDFITADASYYAINPGNTGNMVAKTYIYIDVAVATNAYQTTTTPENAVGAGRCLVAIAQNAVGEATYMVMQGQGGINIDAANIVAGTITANELATSITYAGAIIVDTNGLIRSGQTAYNTGTGWWIGNVGGTPKLSIGVSTGNNLTWDGTTLTVKGSVDMDNLLIFGDGSDGDVTINADTTLTRDWYYNNLTINAGKYLYSGGYRIFVRGTLTNNGSISVNGGDGGVAGVNNGGVMPYYPVTYLGYGGSGGNGTQSGAGGSGSTADNFRLGGTGGNGGDGTGGTTGGLGGGGTTLPAYAGSFKSLPGAIEMINNTTGNTLCRLGGGTGGGGGGGNGALLYGGGGGAGAGVIVVSARYMVNAGAISANGGNGGNGVVATTGKGAGGGGGYMNLIYHSYSGAGTKTASAGSAAAVGTGAPTAAEAGTVVELTI